MSNLGIRLKEERERLRLSQTAFAEIGGVTKFSQINYEKGERSPDSSYLTPLAKIGVDVYYILTGERKQPPSEVLEPEEKVLLNAYRALPDKSKKEILLSILAGEDIKKIKKKKDPLVQVKGENNIVKTVKTKNFKGNF